jgi:cytochrome c oxidase subunit 4
MAESNLTYDQEQHVESHAPYLKVWFALLVLTILEYFYAMLMAEKFIHLVLGLLMLAIIKALLVAWYFMHLKFEGRWVYFMLVPAGILMMVFMSALYPDIGMQRNVYPDYPDDEEASVAPVSPVPTIALRS